MANLSPTGNPDLHANIASGGQFTVRVGTNHRLQVHDNGRVTFHGSIHRNSASPLRLWNEQVTSSGPITEFMIGPMPRVTKLSVEASSGGVTLRAPVSGDTVSVQGETVRMVGAAAAPSSTMFVAVEGAQERLAAGYDSDDNVVSLEAPTSSDHLRLEGQELRLASRSGTITRYYSGSLERASLGYATGVVTLATVDDNDSLSLETDAGGNGSVSMKGASIELEPRSTAGDAVRVTGGGGLTVEDAAVRVRLSGTSILELGANSPNARLQSLAGRHLEVKGAGQLQLTAGNGDLAMSTIANATLQIGNGGTNSFILTSGATPLVTVTEAQITSFYGPGGNAMVTIDPSAATGEVVLTVGDTVQGEGHVAVNGKNTGAPGTQRAGLLALGADDAVPAYLSVWTNGTNYELWLTKTAPTARPTTGSPIKVV